MASSYLSWSSIFEVLGYICRRIHCNSIPSHPLANVHANLATDTLVKAHLNRLDDDSDVVGQVAWHMLNTVYRAKRNTSFTTRTIVRVDDRKNLWGFLLPRDLTRGIGNDGCRVCFLWISDRHMQLPATSTNPLYLENRRFVQWLHQSGYSESKPRP